MMVGDDVVTLLYSCVFSAVLFIVLTLTLNTIKTSFSLIYCITATVSHKHSAHTTHTFANAYANVCMSNGSTIHIASHFGWDDKNCTNPIWLLFARSISLSPSRTRSTIFHSFVRLIARPYANYTLWPEPNDYAISTSTQTYHMCAVYSLLFSLTLSFSKVHAITFNIQQTLPICISGAAPVSYHIVLVVFQLSRSKHMHTQHYQQHINECEIHWESELGIQIAREREREGGRVNNTWTFSVAAAAGIVVVVG